MTSFSTLSTALSALTAHRAALDVAGQNVANANTVGYTRQRAQLSSVSTAASASLFSAGLTVGQGVNVTGVARLGDIFADARVRSTTSSAAFLATRADALTRLESTITEPGDDGIASQLGAYWAAWQDVSNNPAEAAPGQVLIEAGRTVATAIATGYRAVDTLWTETRSQADAYVTEVNAVAQGIAQLNDTIRSVLVSGGNANELIDKRDQLATTMSELTGATVRPNEDGTVNVSIGGNPVVSGTTAYGVRLTGATTMAGAEANPVSLVWEREGAGAVVLGGGLLAGTIGILAPADATGTGGVLAEAAASYNALATSLATSVNAVHQGGLTRTGEPGGDFFSLGTDPAVPAALGLAVAVTSPSQIAAAAPGQGSGDGSVADQISRIGASTDGPDRLWAAFVVDVGVKTQSAVQSARVSESARATAESLQLAQTSVDIDEETVNMLASQRAYQAAARVMTTVDEMLDTLINRTGVVGR